MKSIILKLNDLILKATINTNFYPRKYNVSKYLWEVVDMSQLK